MRRYPHLFSLLSLVGSLVLALPVDAAQFRNWRFDQQQNRLEFSTIGGVQPRAQLLFNPTRIVVDLPGTTLDRPTINQTVGGTVQAVRIGQFNDQTTRLVIELSPGYTVDPAQVVVQGQTPQSWAIQLPAPQTASAQPAIAQPVAATPVPGAATQVEGVRATPDGFFIRTSGTSPDLSVERVSDTQVVLQVNDATVATALTGQTLPVNQFGVRAWDVQPLTVNGKPALRLVLTVPAGSADWQASVSNGSGIVVLPSRGIDLATVPSSAGAGAAIATAEPQAPAADPPPIAVQPPQAQTPATPPQPAPVAPGPAAPDLRNVTPQGAITVIIDPGHGGTDPGAIGVGGLREKDVVASISYEVASILEQSGVRVVLTRSDDQFIDLDPRVQIAERADADLFVSIHANSISLDRPDVNGLETYYYQSGSRLAQVIHQSILQLLHMPDRGVRQARFYVIRNTSMPAVLVETGFVTGAQDARNFNDPNWRHQMSRAIASGILQYVQQGF
jgi:N-acetylmuramoyl-L-alanine amidase